MISEHPECFSYVMSSQEYLDFKGITQNDCKKCNVKEECIIAYNGRVYNVWVNEWWAMTEEEAMDERADIEAELRYENEVTDDK